MYHDNYSLSSVIVLQLLLVVSALASPTVKPTVKWSSPMMIMMNVQADANPTPNQARASVESSEQSLPNKIKEMEGEVVKDQARSSGLNEWTILLGVMYVAISAAFVAVSLAAIPANGRLQKDEKTLSGLLIEQERQRTLQLWKDVAPREIADQSGMVAALKPFAGVKFVLVSLADVETVHTAEQIYASLTQANWVEARPPEKTLDDSRFMDDVLIQNQAADRMTTNAADTLMAQLERNNVRGRRVPYNENDAQIYGFGEQPVVLIKVGFKSFPQPPGRPEPAAIGRQQLQMRGNRRKFPPPQNR